MRKLKKTNFARQLRRNQTSAEELLWQELRGRRCGGYKFRRQVPKDKFVVDFLCESQKLIVEVDGPTHESREDYDAERTAMLNQMGYQVLRVGNEDCYDDLNATVDHIWQTLENAKP